MGSTFEVVSIFDPAVDWAAMRADDKFDAYADSDTAQRDLSLLAPYLIPGRKPTVYTLRECSQEQWISFVREAGTHNMQAYRALLSSLVSAKDLRTSDGLSMGPEFKFARYPKSEVVRAEALRDRMTNRQIEDLAEVAYLRGFFQGETEFGYRLQPTLRELHAAWVRRHAAANPSSQDGTNETASEG